MQVEKVRDFNILLVKYVLKIQGREKYINTVYFVTNFRLSIKISGLKNVYLFKHHRKFSKYANSFTRYVCISWV